MRTLLQFSVFTLLILTFAGCTRDAEVHPARRQVNFYGWGNYIPQEVLTKFTAKTGIEVVHSEYSTNEEMIEKLQSGVADIDVANPSDYMIPALRAQGLILKLDHTRIPNLKNIGKRFRDTPLDPGSEFSMPFLWSVIGIGYDRTRIKETVDSWNILWNPEYKNRILMLDDPSDCFAAALKLKGYSANSGNPKELLEARDLLIDQKPLVKIYNSSNYEDIFLTGDVWVGQVWNGQMAVAIQRNPNLAFVIPKEGGSLSADHLVISSNAPHPEEAYVLINYLLDAHVGAEITNRNLYPNTNEAAKAFINPAILANGVTYPDQTSLSRCENASEEHGAISQLRDRYWTEIKSM
jgi:spermidine/putrescine-binding protein